MSEPAHFSALEARKCDGSGPLVYFNPSAFGGLADYAHEQANALVQAGRKVLMVCPSDFQSRSQPLYARRDFPANPGSGSRPSFRIARALRMAKGTLAAWKALAAVIDEIDARAVLLGAYSEYFSPIWARRFDALARRGVVFGAVVHDPVRDAVLGPAWWHHWSVKRAYSFLECVFVHESVNPEALGSHPGTRIFKIPHGPYRLGIPSADRRATRTALKLPHEAFTLLAFGHIRDNKNLDLAVRALAVFPEAHLIVAGRELSGREKQAGYYMALAESAGVAARCRWLVRHIPDDEAASLFEASDAVLLNYGASFKSASGVLAAAVGFRRPCVASSGAGPLRHLVDEYKLGPWVEPDSLDALVEGVRAVSGWGLRPEWERFERENSWERNASTVIASFNRAMQDR